MTQIFESLIRFGRESTVPLVISMMVAGFVIVVVDVWITLRRARKPRVEEGMQKQLGKTLRALEQDSSEAMKLLTLLQDEVTRRTTTVQEIEAKLNELRQQRTLLQLTDEQRNAIEGLIRRK